MLINGKEVAFEAYGIGGNNYFKLRDLAQAINGTEKNFEVTWDGDNNAINLLTKKMYTSVGGELKVKANTTTTDAIISPSKIYVNGNQTEFLVYTIGGNNYFKLRDVGKVINFGVTWDGGNNIIKIDTITSYTE